MSCTLHIEELILMALKLRVSCDKEKRDIFHYLYTFDLYIPIIIFKS